MKISVSIFLLLISVNFYFSELYADSTKSNLQITDFINKANGLIQGEIVKAERKFKSGKGYWEIKMIAKDGGEIKFEFDLKNGELMEAESSDGPFNYNLNPHSKNTDLQTAKSKTETELEMKIMKWEYKPVKEKWEWRFWYLNKTGVPQLRVDAETGEFITSGRK